MSERENPVESPKKPLKKRVGGQKLGVVGYLKHTTFV